MFNEKAPQIGRDDFARAWAEGTGWEQGQMLYDLVKDGTEAKALVKRHLAYIYGGLTVISVLAGTLGYFLRI